MAEYIIHEIKYPEKKTYWIFWVDKVTNFTYGSVNTDQVIEGYAEQTWTTTVESEWIDKLKTEFNTEVAVEEKEEVVESEPVKKETTDSRLKQLKEKHEWRKKMLDK